MKLAAILVVASGSGLASGICPTLPTDAYDLELPYAAHNKNVSIPPLPPAGADYSYATDNAMIAIPASCVTDFAADITESSDLQNKRACDSQGMKYLRISDLVGGYAKLMTMKDCAKGLVIGLHGSGGVGWGQVQFAAIFSGWGYLYVIPDSQSMPDSLGLKGKTPNKAGKDIDTSNYCDENGASEGSCSNFPDDKPYCYSSKIENIVNDPDNYKIYVEGMYQIRKREMDYFVDTHHEMFSEFKTMYAVGNSEGAMALSRYYHAQFHSELDGIVIDGWSCEYNYFVACEEWAKICEDSCDKSIPIIDLNGDKDEFFGPDSLASKVAADDNGYGASTITGNCRVAFEAQGFTHSTTVVWAGVWHTTKYQEDNAVRAVLEDWLGSNVKAWVNDFNCKVENNIYACPESDEPTCKWSPTRLNENETCMCCNIDDDDSKAASLTYIAAVVAVLTALTV